MADPSLSFETDISDDLETGAVGVGPGGSLPPVHLLESGRTTKIGAFVNEAVGGTT